ncbi:MULTISPECIES: 30S ribosomal protein S18 [Actinokineospora]|uniref:Small ribosomal subunit protein bS18 n=1 Tax=Actinokineospora fastidiosa TaxID=1816 RepID=A0A918G3F5_9PSEU|nr:MULTISPECIES: 30S ribosomal protein S18 [Actinokineospora]UVS76881.1 30S ribosomal protein S18 1 [Actinokineospora sp. UTMC 2448]GGS15154.1 30S ribosomal protein S18 [Actinokineospora fastidiosa]
MAKKFDRPVRKKANPLITEGIERVDWKNAQLLRKFISDRGKIRARRVTGLTPQQQKQVATAIKNAREMALLPYPGSGRS